MSAIMAKMVRTTIMANDQLLADLREIARDDGISLGEVIRQALEWRVKTRRRPPSFIGAVASDGTHDASRDEEVLLEYARRKDARRRDARL